MRLIINSGELGLRHAADLTHPSPAARAGGLVDIFPAARPASLRREAISYAASSVLAALILAAILFFVVPQAMRG